MRISVKNITATVITLATIGTASGAEYNASAPSTPDYATRPFYRAGEFSVDAFGSGSVGQQTIDSISGSRVSRDVRLGAGIGANYFFTRYLGLGAEVYSESLDHAFVDSGSLNLIGRLPIGQTGLAPYLLIGGGRQFEQPDQWLLNAGAGLEMRFHPNWGIFVDARYVFTEETKNIGLGRIGLRFNF